jgi:hypothetical protein
LGQYVPNLSLLSRPPFFRLRLSFASRLSFKNLFASTLFLAVFVSLLLYILGSYLSSQSVSSIYDMYSADMGGSLVVPDSIPVLLKPFAFLFLPLPFLPFSFASLPLAISTLIMVSIISKIISLRLRSTGFSLLSVGIIMFLTISFMFAILLLLVPHLPSLPERR